MDNFCSQENQHRNQDSTLPQLQAHFLGVFLFIFFFLLSITKEDLKHLPINLSCLHPHPTLQPHPEPSQLGSNPSLPQFSQTEKDSITKVEPMTFLSEFLPGFWKHTPIQIFAAILIYAAMQQGDDHKTRALLNPVLF